ncbi:unnamed protein product [Schistosoma curassoni]|nr:unnamed protein product [Schistosoma curassoni]
MSSVSQGKNEKMLASHESALTPTLKWRKNQFTCNNSNTTTTATNILTPRNDVSYATFLSYPHQSGLMAQSTTSPQYMLPNDCIIKSLNDNSNDLKEINSIPLSNIKMVLTERKKSSYPDLFMLKTNQNVTTNHILLDHLVHHQHVSGLIIVDPQMPCSSSLSSKLNRTHDPPSVVISQIFNPSVFSSKSVHSSLSSNNN